MAAVMLGGMVPPLGVALACTFFPECFTKAERHSALMNYLMGFSFITEGALPFALKDPLRVIPSCVAGSGPGRGALDGLELQRSGPRTAGLYVLPLAENAPGMLLALALGSVLTAGLLGLLKHPRTPRPYRARPRKRAVKPAPPRLDFAQAVWYRILCAEGKSYGPAQKRRPIRYAG